MRDQDCGAALFLNLEPRGGLFKVQWRSSPESKEPRDNEKKEPGLKKKGK